MRSLCVVRDGHLPAHICEALIKLFHDRREVTERFDLDRRPNFTQLNITAEIGNSQFHDVLVGAAMESVRFYRKQVRETEYWPPKIALEQFRIKQYRGGTDDQFDTHVDVTSIDTAKRFLIFFWYLNDVPKGGETEIFFRDGSLKVKPQKGKLVMFPPFWMFPHKGHPAAGGDKYLLSSYLHYDDRE